MPSKVKTDGEKNYQKLDLSYGVNSLGTFHCDSILIQISAQYCLRDNLLLPPIY